MKRDLYSPYLGISPPPHHLGRKPRENINAFNIDSRSGLITIKLMEETDLSVQIHSFHEVTAVRYDEKPDKDGQRRDICDIVTRRNVLKQNWQWNSHLPVLYLEVLPFCFRMWLRFWIWTKRLVDQRIWLKKAGIGGFAYPIRPPSRGSANMFLVHKRA